MHFFFLCTHQTELFPYTTLFRSRTTTFSTFSPVPKFRPGPQPPVNGLKRPGIWRDIHVPTKSGARGFPWNNDSSVARPFDCPSVFAGGNSHDGVAGHADHRRDYDSARGFSLAGAV